MEKSGNLAFVKQINISVNFQLFRLTFGAKVADLMLFKCIKNGHFKIIRFGAIDTFFFIVEEEKWRNLL